MRDHSRDLKVTRKVWLINPRERIVTSKKEYDRSTLKEELRKDLLNTDSEEYDDYEWYNDVIDLNTRG